VCGDDALSFVRFRHTDSDLVRNARQQDFLRWVKAQYSASKLVANRDTLTRIFAAHAQTDHNLHTLDGLINLFNLVAFSAGHQVKSIPFPAIELPCGAAAGARGAFFATPCYVTANPRAEAAAYKAFMTPTIAHAAPPPVAPVPALPRAHGRRPPAPPPAAVSADVADGQAQAAALGRMPMPVMFPARIASGSRYCTNATCTIGPVANSYPRAYAIHGQNGGKFAAYRMTLVVNPALGEYYGVQGTTWQNPPILNSPTQTRSVAGKRLLLYFNGHKISLVAYRTPAAVYWISNSLTDSLTNSQMLAIAASLTPAR
jgi:hypothetical protein